MSTFTFGITDKNLTALAKEIIATPTTMLQADDNMFPLAAAVLFTSVLHGRHRLAGKIMRAHPELVTYPLSKHDFANGADVLETAKQTADRVYLVHMQAASWRVNADERDAYQNNTRFILQNTPIDEPLSAPRQALDQAIGMAQYFDRKQFVADTLSYQPRLAELRQQDQRFGGRRLAAVHVS